KGYTEEKEQSKRKIRVYSSAAYSGKANVFKRLMKNEMTGITRRIFGRSRREETYSLPDRVSFVAEPEDKTYECEEKTVLLGADTDSIVGRLIYRGYEDEESFVIDKDEYVVGSSQKADGVLKNPTVSRLHARIEKTDDIYILSDLNSKNGTTLNGEEIPYKERQVLKKNDTIRFADCEYLFI
ncbi:MAG: FHA domain-containing protein, partial [Lachnospiraceae bacterium]|nr:FHA domain-containing protein [Lachnospiraceae bacterium]